MPTTTESSPVYTLPSRLQQAVVETPCKLRLVTLAALLARSAAQAPGRAKVVVFFSACDCVEFAHRLLEGALGNLPGCGTLFKLHGLMTQVQAHTVLTWCLTILLTFIVCLPFLFAFALFSYSLSQHVQHAFVL